MHKKRWIKYDKKMPKYWLPVITMRNILNPLEKPVWYAKVTSRSEIERALQEFRLEEMPNPKLSSQRPSDYNDAERIAFLITNPPIDWMTIDVNEHGGVCIEDGCHRLAAAIYMRARYIKVDFGGYVHAFEKRFPTRYPVRYFHRNLPTWVSKIP